MLKKDDPYDEMVSKFAEKVARLLLEEKHYCMCSINRTKVTERLLPVCEMFELEIHMREELAVEFVAQHLTPYVHRQIDDLLDGCHQRPGDLHKDHKDLSEEPVRDASKG